MPHVPTRMLVISAKSGQLGNRLLLFAHFIAFALEHNFRVLNPAFEEYAEFFQSTAKDFLCGYPSSKFSMGGNKFIRKQYYSFNRYLTESKKFNTIAIDRERPFSWSKSALVKQIKPETVNFFQGWIFRDGWFVDDLENLHKHAEEIRSYFTPLEQYQLNVSKLISKLRGEADILIGVHIRQGDYQQHQAGRYFYPTEQYLQILELAHNLFPHQRVTFLICSNVEQKQFANFRHAWGNNHIIEDMYALAQCDYIIGPPSSYTMWASFYGDKPLYMIRNVNKVLELKDFVHFYNWQGTFHYRDDWSKSFWEWTH